MSDAPEIRDQSIVAIASRRRAPGATVGMELMPQSILKDVPALYATERIALAEKIVKTKLFIPWTNWTFFVIECDAEGKTAWGIVQGFEDEIGYFDIPELAAVRGPGGLTVERDLHFTPCTVAELVQRERLDITL